MAPEILRAWKYWELRTPLSPSRLKHNIKVTQRKVKILASEILRAWKYWELGTPLSLQDLNIESKLAAQPTIAGS